MKKIIVFTLLLIIGTATFSQQTKPSPALTKQDYLQKSKKQKTAAWVLVGGGAVMAIVSLSSFNFINIFGPIIDPNNPGQENLKRGETTFYIGCIAALSSIPLFIASSKNKTKGMSISLKNETSPQLQKSSLVYKPVPSLTLKIQL